MKRHIKTQSNALTALVMLALSSTLLAQEPTKPRLRPADAKPAAEEPAKPKEEGVLRGGGEKPTAPAPAAPAAAPAARPAPPEGKPVKDPLFPPGVGVPTIKGDKKDPGEPGIFKGEPLKAANKKDPDEQGVKEGSEPKGEMKKPAGVRSVDGPAIVKPAESEKSATEPAKNPIAAADFEASVKRKYDSLDHKCVSFEEFIGFERLEAERLQKLKENPASRYSAMIGKTSGGNACENGDFEPNGLQPGWWGFGWGTVPNSGVVDTTSFTTGQLSGPITSATARHTITTAGIDPNVGIQMTGPDATGNPSAHAIRLGNAAAGKGAELISKTFTVTPATSTIRFWYAAVFQYYPHADHQQGAFTVRVLDSAGNPAPGAVVDLGNGSGKIFAALNNPFFKTKPGNLVYRDWSCAQINLDRLIGKPVTIQFITQDCSPGANWGYAYIDNLCGQCGPTGDIQFDKASDKCGRGKICFKVSLPKQGTTVGTGVVALKLYQNANATPVATFTSPTLSGSTTSHCFNINPSNIPGLNTSLSGFDFSATGTFTLGTNVTTLTVGNGADGQIVGKNNDYQIACPKPEVTDPCCADAGKNLFPNGTMDIGGGAPGSRYEFVTVGPRNPLLPGRVTLTDVGAIEKICTVWELPPACKKTKDFSGGVMVVNGLTNQPAGQQTAIVQEKLSLPKPDAGDLAEYRVCFRYLPLPSCCFNVTPKLTVVVKKTDGTPIAVTTISDAPTGCGNLYSASFKAPQGVVIFEILLAEDAKGDGNDLMIDNVSIRQLVAVPNASLMFNLIAADAGGGNYHITLTAPAGLTNPPYNWVWEAWGPGTANPTTVGGNVATTNFGNMNFVSPNQYTFKLKAWSPCHSLSGSKQTWSFDPTARKAQQQPEVDPNPEPVKESK